MIRLRGQSGIEVKRNNAGFYSCGWDRYKAVRNLLRDALMVDENCKNDGEKGIWDEAETHLQKGFFFLFFPFSTWPEFFSMMIPRLTTYQYRFLEVIRLHHRVDLKWFAILISFASLSRNWAEPCSIFVDCKNSNWLSNNCSLHKQLRLFTLSLAKLLKLALCQNTVREWMRKRHHSFKHHRITSAV